MSDVFVFVSIIGVWLVLQLWLLPRMGVQS